MGFEALFYQLSYFAKMKTKQYHGNVQAFRTSRVEKSIF